MLGRVIRRSWHRHRLFLPYGYFQLALTVSQWMRGVDGSTMSATRGWTMPAAGRVVGHSVTLDVDSVTGGTVTYGVYVNGSLLSDGQLAFTTAAADQTGSSRFHSPRFASGSFVGVQAVVASTITYDDMMGLIEVELDR